MEILLTFHVPIKGRLYEKTPVPLEDGADVQDLLDRVGLSRQEVGLVVVNARDATLDLKLKDGDTVSVMPRIMGG